VATLHDDVRRRAKYLHKTLWAIRPEAREALRVRGISLRNSQPLQFFVDNKALDHLNLPEPTCDWSYAATATVLPGPGCYAFHVQGRTTDDWIVFQAIVGLGPTRRSALSSKSSTQG